MHSIAELYRSAHQIVEYYSEYSLMKRVLMGNTQNPSWTSIQQEWLAYVNLVYTYKPLNILLDARSFDVLLTKEMQDWINEKIISVVNQVGLEKWAIIIPPQFLNQLSLEQTIEANPNNTFEVHYFENEEDALLWLKK